MELRQPSYKTARMDLRVYTHLQNQQHLILTKHYLSLEYTNIS